MSETLINIRYVDASGSHEANVSELNDFMEKHPDITQLTLPDGLVELDWNSSLSNYSLRNSSLRRTENLESIVLPDTLKVLPYGFGSGCNSLKSITFPNGMESIPDKCCSGCGSLESVVLPESIKKIGAGAFSGCQNLENVEFQGCPDVIERNAFRGDKKLMAPEWTNPSNTHPGAFDFTKGKSCECAVEYVDGSKGTLSIDDAAKSLLGVAHISLPEGMTRLDENMFRGTQSLVSMTLPGSMQFLEPRVLNCESSLCAVYFNENHPPKFVTDEDEITCLFDRDIICDCYGYEYDTYDDDYEPFANCHVMQDLYTGKSSTKAQFDERVSNLSVSHVIQKFLEAKDDRAKYNFLRFKLMMPLIDNTMATDFESTLNVRQAGLLSGVFSDSKYGYERDLESITGRTKVRESYQLELDENSMYDLSLCNGERSSVRSLRFNQDGSLNVDDCYIEQYDPLEHNSLTYPDKFDTAFRAMKPDVHHPSFRTTLLDIGWPEDIVDSLKCQDDVIKLRESNPVLKQLANMPADYEYVSGEESFKEAQRIVAQKNVSESKEAQQTENEKSPVYLKHVSEKMIRFVHSDKTGKDYARVGVNLMLDGKQFVGNILLPVDSVTESAEKNSKYQRTKKMDVCLGGFDDRLKVSLGKNPDGTWQHKFMTVREIKTFNEEAMKAYLERRMDEYNSTVENSLSHEQQNDEFDS